MSMSDDPRGYRRGQGRDRDREYPPRQSPGNRNAPPADDRYDPYRQAEPPARSQRPQPPQQPRDKAQPSFSAYKPEAYAKPDPATPPERPEWSPPRGNGPAPRSAPPAPDPYAPAPSDPYAQPQSPSHDPFYSDAASDPYAPRSPRSYDRDWGQDSFQDVDAPQFPNYYAPPDDPAPSGPDAQSMHDRFFAPEPPMDDAPPAASGGRFRDAFDDDDFDGGRVHGFDDEPDDGYNRQPVAGFGSEPPARPVRSPYDPEPDMHRRDPAGYPADFDDDQYYDWDKYEQQPAPQSLRPAQAPGVPDEDMDADFFADEEDFDGEDYEPERSGGRIKLIAAVLTGAVVVGGGLAFFYKTTMSNSGDGSGAPALISADTTPVKEEPDAPGGRDFPNQDKRVYDRLPGYASGGGSQQASADASSSGSSGAVPGIVTTGTLEERIENALKTQGGDTSSASSGAQVSPDAPRSVQTLTFGPDGSQQDAQTRTRSVRAPQTQEAPEAVPNAGIVVTTNPSQARSQQSAGVVTTGQSVGGEEQTSGSNASASGSGSSNNASETQLASLSEPTQPQVTEQPSATGGFFVQIGARNDRDAAISAFQTLQQRYAPIIGELSPSVRKADLGDKGVWYRLLIGPVASKGEADGICEQLKGAGMKGCFSRKN